MISSCSKSLQKGYIIYLVLLFNNFASFLHGKAILEKNSLLSKCSFPSLCECAPVLRQVLDGGPFLTEASHTRIKSKARGKQWIKLWRTHSQTNTGRWEYQDNGGLDLKVNGCLRLLILNLWHLYLLFFLFMTNFCSITDQRDILCYKFSPDFLQVACTS